MTPLPPVALLVFNRPTLTAQVLGAVRQARPPKLFVVADGPRPGRPDDERNCAEVRRLFESVDWPCEVHLNYAERNLGCCERVSSGISWVFEQVPEAIILEDDCLPSSSFFPFCAELLARYRDDSRVMGIAGSRLVPPTTAGGPSYTFFRTQFIWGWATWARAWRHYDVSISDWPVLRRQRLLRSIISNPVARWRVHSALNSVYSGQLDTWDYQWTLATWSRGGLVAVPSVNLVSNLGFGPDATHTKTNDPLAESPRGTMEFPLAHPASLEWDRRAEQATLRRLFLPRWRSLPAKILHRLGRHVRARETA